MNSNACGECSIPCFQMRTSTHAGRRGNRLEKRLATRQVTAKPSMTQFWCNSVREDCQNREPEGFLLDLPNFGEVLQAVTIILLVNPGPNSKFS